jgi:hypothetical protein
LKIHGFIPEIASGDRQRSACFTQGSGLMKVGFSGEEKRPFVFPSM